MGEWNCTEFERELQQCLDARRPLSSLGIAERQIRCGHCRGLWEQFLLLEQALAGLGCRPADAGFSEAVVARVLLDSDTTYGGCVVPNGASIDRTEKRSAASRRWTAIAAAAVVLLACIAPLVWQPQNRIAGPAAPPDQRIAQDANTRTSRGSEDDLRFLLRDAGTAYSGLAREAHTVVADATRFVPTAFPHRGPTRDIGIPVANPQWVDEWRRDLKPIGDDVQQALGFLFEAVAVEVSPSI